MTAKTIKLKEYECDSCGKKCKFGATHLATNKVCCWDCHSL